MWSTLRTLWTCGGWAWLADADGIEWGCLIRLPVTRLGPWAEALRWLAVCLPHLYLTPSPRVQTRPSSFPRPPSPTSNSSASAALETADNAEQEPTPPRLVSASASNDRLGTAPLGIRRGLPGVCSRSLLEPRYRLHSQLLTSSLTILTSTTFDDQAYRLATAQRSLSRRRAQ